MRRVVCRSIITHYLAGSVHCLTLVSSSLKIDCVTHFTKIQTRDSQSLNCSVRGDEVVIDDYFLPSEVPGSPSPQLLARMLSSGSAGSPVVYSTYVMKASQKRLRAARHFDVRDQSNHHLRRLNAPTCNLDHAVAPSWPDSTLHSD